MNQICKDLLKQRLEELTHGDGAEYVPLKISNRFVRWLFNHYYCHEFLECYFDSEPNIPEEQLDAYLDYSRPYPDFKYCKTEHTEDELREAFEAVRKAYHDYEPQRLKFNNWIDVNGRGIWGMSQKTVDSLAREYLIGTKTYSPGYHGRLFISYKGDMITIYYFGRDARLVDFIWTFKKRARRLR